MSIKIEEAYNRLEDVKALFAEYVRSLDVDLSFQNFNEELSNLPGKYARPDGRLYIAYSDGKIAGCIALRKYSEQKCEMKRLYVRDEFRGLKIGRLLAEQVISDAKEIGYSYMILDTLPAMENARALYKKLGFVEIAPYYNNPIKGTSYLCFSL